MSYTIGCILLPNYSGWAYLSITSPLQKFNSLVKHQAYQVFTVGVDESCVHSDIGHKTITDFSLRTAPRANAWFVLGGTAEHETSDRALIDFLTYKPDDCLFGGFSSGICVLAEAGRLDGYKSVFCSPLHESGQRKSTIRFVHEPYCIDRDRLTCMEDGAALAMMLSWVTTQQGPALASLLTRYYEEQTRAMLPQGNKAATGSVGNVSDQPKLAEALDLMHSNIMEPLTTQEISDHISISRRQLERLFKKYLDTVPSRYYMRMRLEGVRRLLTTTPYSISEIASAYGFSSGAHLATSYRRHFGTKPSVDRIFKGANEGARLKQQG